MEVQQKKLRAAVPLQVSPERLPEPLKVGCHTFPVFTGADVSFGATDLPPLPRNLSTAGKKMSDLATVLRHRKTLDGWEAKLDNRRFHAPTMRFEYDRAWDRHERAKEEFCKLDPQSYAEAFPHSVARYVEHMPCTEERRKAAFSCETDADLLRLIQSWRTAPSRL